MVALGVVAPCCTPGSLQLPADSVSVWKAGWAGLPVLVGP